MVPTIRWKGFNLSVDKQTRTFFNDIASTWDDKSTQRGQTRLPAVFKAYLPDLHGQVLDAGSGTGVLISVLQQYPAIELVIELDIAEKMLKESRNIHADASYVHHINASAIQMPFQNQSFDHIIAYAVFPHLPSQEQALTEFFRVLIPGGSLTILHLMGHKELNKMHKEAHNMVARHQLQPVGIVSDQLTQQGFHPKLAEEQSDLYIIRAIKPAN